MKRAFLFFVFTALIIITCYCQEKDGAGGRFLFYGIVNDARSYSPLSNTQISINGDFTLSSNYDGTFSFLVNRKDTVLFRHLGYKQALMVVSDTLSGLEFAVGIFLETDTLKIAEVIIVPRYVNFRYQILNSPSKVPAIMENAKHNVALSAYQGRTTQGKLGDPMSNYELLRQKYRNDAYEKGGIPSDRIAGFSPFILLPAAYLLINGIPEKPGPYERKLTIQELDHIQKQYMESLK